MSSWDPLQPWHPRRGEASTWDRAAAQHLFRRAAFGASRARIQQALEEGVEATLEQLFARDAHDPRLMRGVQALLPLNEVSQLQGWWTTLILSDGAPLRERLALFWHDHFATSNDKVEDARMMYAQNQLFREQGGGDFRSLLGAVARDPAMLVWLDGNANRKGAPNENFAREVLELFALGIGNYGEKDVQEAARAFTGWGTEGRSFAFRERYHDAGTKAVLGHTGTHGGDAVLRIVTEHPACARHIARRLLEAFIIPNPPEAWIERCVRLLLSNDWNVTESVRTLVRSELFFSPAARRARVAAPLELVAVTAHALEAQVPPADVARASARMGQALFLPPTVKGWDGMHAWIDAGTWTARHNALATMVEQHDDLHAVLGQPSTRVDVPAAVLETLLPEPTEAAFLAVLSDVADEAPDMEQALRDVTQLVLTSPEYHRF